jgi:nucleoid-associated protein YgaU
MMQLYPVRGIGITTPEFRVRLREVSDSLTVDPTDLASIIAFESGFSPRARNHLSNATGLIQWIPTTAAALYRLTIEQIANMSAVEQLDLVERYFAGIRGRGASLHDLYMLVWNGSPATPETVLGVADAAGHAGAVYRQNSALDLNHDGRITAGEASYIVRQIATQARLLPPLPDDDPKAPASTGTSASSLGPLLSPSRYYRVKPGDTAWQLAKRLADKYARWVELYHVNPRSKIDHLVAGSRIVLPEGWRNV